MDGKWHQNGNVGQPSQPQQPTAWHLLQRARGLKPLPHVVIRDISANFYRRALLDTLPQEIRNAMAGYIWIDGDTPEYLNWNRDPTKNALVIYFLPMIGSTDPAYGFPPQRSSN